MKRRTRQRARNVVVGLGLVALSGCFNPILTVWPPFYTGAPIVAWVREAGTGRPLPGVIVVASWVSELPNGHETKQIQVLETVTDVNGRFELPAWGPHLRGVFGLIHQSDPKLLFVAPRLGTKVVANFKYWERGGRRNVGTAVRRYSDWNGQVIEVDSVMDQGPKAYCRRQLDLLTLDTGWASRGCWWNRTPRFYAAMVKAGAWCEQHGQPVRPRTIAEIDRYQSSLNRWRCGKHSDVLRRNGLL